MKNTKNRNNKEYYEIKKSELLRSSKGEMGAPDEFSKASENNVTDRTNRTKIIKDNLLAALFLAVGLVVLGLKEIFIGILFIVCGVGILIVNLAESVHSRSLYITDDKPKPKLNPTDNDDETGASLEDTLPLEDFDFEIKHKVLLQKKTKNLDIKYVRVKSVNKLVIN